MNYHCTFWGFIFGFFLFFSCFLYVLISKCSIVLITRYIYRIHNLQYHIAFNLLCLILCNFIKLHILQQGNYVVVNLFLTKCDRLKVINYKCLLLLSENISLLHYLSCDREVCQKMTFCCQKYQTRKKNITGGIF